MINRVKVNDDGTVYILDRKRDGTILQTVIDYTDYLRIKGYETKWSIFKHNKYGTYRVSGIVEGKRVYLYHLIVPCPQGFVIDHIDRDTLNNRKSNLRVATYLENSRNQKIKKTKFFSYVYFDKRIKRYRVRIPTDHKKINLGSYLDLDEAVQVAKEYIKGKENVSS